jgi:hypothetical protein
MTQQASTKKKRMKTNLTHTALGLLALALSIPASPAAEVTYQFNSVVEADNSIASIAPRGLNNRGDVIVFTQGTDGSQTLWLADRRSTTPVVQTSPPNSIGRSTRCLSDSGRVAFLLSDQGPVAGDARARIIVASATGWSTLLEARPASDGMQLGAPVINNEGVVAVRISQRGRTRIVMTDGVAPATVVDLPGPTGILSTPEINNEDVVAYERTDVSDPANTDHGVYLWQAGASVRVFDPNSQPGEFSRRLSAAGLALNDFGSVAVRTLASNPLPTGSPIVTNRIVRVDGGVVTTIAQRSDNFRPATGFSLNNAGDVVFLAHDALGVGTIYVGNGVETHRVLGAGDVLEGRTVLRLDPSALINERGQVALMVTYTDGGRAVLRATRRAQK